MAYDDHRRTVWWFERALRAMAPSDRFRAVQLLRDVENPRRAEWLREASDDPDPRIAAEAVVIAASIEFCETGVGFDLFESDFACGFDDTELEWEWEYRIVVCEDRHAPLRPVVVWTRTENDREARRLAMMKAQVGRDEAPVTPIVIDRRFVNQYTRSPKSFAEAMRWHRQGRPRYGAEG